MPSVQIAHYYVPENQEGFVVETWFNPPAANAVAMPGFLEKHSARMALYASSISAAPLVGTRPVGTIRLEGDRTVIDFPIGFSELAGLRSGIVKLTRAFLSNSPDVFRTVAALDGGFECETESGVDALDAALAEVQHDPSQAHRLHFGTGHPQGGNALSEDPALGVVDGEFRVRGVTNLRVCDGSVFPDVAGVNPQWTIMALAHLCAETI